MIITLKFYWEQIQKFLDIDGDAVLCIFTGIILYRLIKGPALNPSEAAVYASCVAAFAASNIGAK